jgi:hypothetical protein
VADRRKGLKAVVQDFSGLIRVVWLKHNLGLAQPATAAHDSKTTAHVGDAEYLAADQRPMWPTLGYK